MGTWSSCRKYHRLLRSKTTATTMGLKTSTKAQAEHVAALLNDICADVTDGGEGVRIDDCITYDKMAEIVDYLRTLDKQDELFESCWVAYKRKGSKKKSKDYWRKLKDDEKARVLPHIKAYTASRDVQFQRDFERYLRDKTFMTLVYQGSNVVYDPTHNDSATPYMPQTGFGLNWDDTQQCYMYIGTWNGFIPDGYTDDNRPDGATVTLNNARGVVVWDKKSKSWQKV